MGALVPAIVGALLALALAPVAIERAPGRLLRTNVNGRKVPAVLGAPLVLGGLGGLLVAALTGSVPVRMGVAVGVALVLMGLAGWFDDTRGDEAARGFRGHLTSVFRGAVTGGPVKIAAGLLAGAVAAVLLEDGIGERVMVVLIVALTANLVNLFDRAPGRAGKVAVILGLLAALADPAGWAVAGAGPYAALAVVLVRDLKEEGMLGDAGANAIGAVLGVGLAVAFEGAGRGLLLGALLAATLASERWSFSAAIERSPLLRPLDMLGRRR